MDRPPRGTHHLLLILLAVIVVSIPMATASQLDLQMDGAHGLTRIASRCTGNSVHVKLTSTSITVTGLPNTACNGRSLQVSVRNSSTTWRASAQVAGAQLTLAMAGAINDVRSVVVTVGTWVVNTTWEAVVPPPPAFSCTSLDDPTLTCSAAVNWGTQWPGPPHTHWQRFINVTTTSTESVRWAVTVNLSHPDLPFEAKHLKDNQAPYLQVVSSSTCSARPLTVTVKGDDQQWGDYYLVAAGVTRNLDLVGMTVDSGNLLNCP